ncbi:UDP-N-acetylmuramoylalanine--D-glutamate ligase OS=Streptomyces alboniger OX=132473 GN=murD PE=3 SV=1 [Streptomyces alboniger]
MEGILVDRAFVENRQKNAQELAEISDVNPPALHNIANALAAAALARAYGVPAAAVRDGLAFTRTRTASRRSPTWPGSRTSTTPRPPTPTAAQASLAAYESIVWIAGRRPRARPSTSWSPRSAGRLRGVVLIGADRALIREALARHAPGDLVVDLDRTDTGAMLQQFEEAKRLAVEGDTVLGRPGLRLHGHVRQLQQAR